MATGSHRPGQQLASLEVGGATVAEYLDGGGLDATLAPRPFFHPVRTLTGTIVTDERPPDHRWHLGVSVTLQDVGGVNFWGGRTYVRDQGYTWRDDHGTVHHVGWHERRAEAFTEELDWTGPDGGSRLRERRAVRADRLQQGAGAWVFEIAFTLRNVTTAPLDLGSPATNGRPGAAYGGFFWRLPPSGSPLRVFTGVAQGEEEVHGSVADWLAVVGDHHGAGYTLLFAGVDAQTRTDPWFVRVADYPGVGSSLASLEPVRLQPQQTTSRHLRVVVADGELTGGEIHALT